MAICGPDFCTSTLASFLVVRFALLTPIATGAESNSGL